MKYYLCALYLVAFVASADTGHVNCPVTPDNAASWKQQINQDAAPVSPPEEAPPEEAPPTQMLAQQFVACLRSPNPLIRDEIGFTGLTRLLREQQVPLPQVTTLFYQLINDISREEPTPEGVFLPFAVLALSEVVRVDRITPYLDATQRSKAIETMATYVANIEDYRGFVAGEGWRHGVAHAADVLMQLSLNPAVEQSQLEQIGAILISAMAPAHHSFIFGEPVRLARATAYTLVREEIESAYWERELNQAASPAPYESWQEMYKSEQGLAVLHNKRAFFNALAALVGYQENPRLQQLAPEIARLARSIG